MEALRAAILPSGLPLFLWPECIKAVVHARNLTPNSTLHHHMLALHEEEAAKRAEGVLSQYMVPIGKNPDGTLKNAEFRWRMKSVKNAAKDAKGNKIMDIV